MNKEMHRFVSEEMNSVLYGGITFICMKFLYIVSEASYLRFNHINLSRQQ